MHLTIGQKIFSAILCCLFLMSAAAGYSIFQTKKIADEVRDVGILRLPISESVNRVGELYLQHNAILQQSISLHMDDQNAADRLHKNLQNMRQNSARMQQEFLVVYALLKETGSPRDAEHIQNIQRSFTKLEQHSTLILDTKLRNASQLNLALIDDLSKHENAMETSIMAFRNHEAEIAHASVTRVEQAEKNLFNTNIALSVLALVTSSGIAVFITRRLTHRLQRLRNGADDVVHGHLDTFFPVLAHDELGELTHSFNEMVKGLRQRERIKETFGKYMDQRVVSNLLDHPELTNPGGTRRNMTVMFIDLKGFTTLSEHLSPDHLIQLVNTYFSHVTEAISAHKGVVDKYMGDGVMAYWGEPFCAADQHAFLACQAAKQIVEDLDGLRCDLKNALGTTINVDDIDFRIGISTGDMVLGTVGSKASRSFTVMGGPVNTGSRLEGANKAYGTRILMCPHTRDAVIDSFPSREIDRVQVKGSDTPLIIYEPIHNRNAFPELGPALTAYRAQDWDLAEQLFRQSKGDTVAETFLNRIPTLRSMPLPADWDGTWIFDTK